MDHHLSLKDDYEQALRDYLTGEGEMPLMRAYECGRSILLEGLGVMDMASIHHQALLELLPTFSDPIRIRRALAVSDKILKESLSPFEMAYRGYRESNTRLEKLVTTLRERTAELAKAVQDRQTAEQLLKAEEKYRFLVEATQALLFSLDRKGRITYVNAEAANTLGYKPDDLIGTLYLRYIHPDDRADVQEQLLRQLKRGALRTLIQFRFQGNNKEGWCSLLVTPVVNGDAVQGYTCAALDTTELNRAESRLRELLAVSQRQSSELRAIVDAMPDAVYMGTQDAITLCNTKALEIFGVDSLDNLQRPVTERAWLLQLRWPDSERSLDEDELPFVMALRGTTVVEEVLLTNGSTHEPRYIRYACAPILAEGKVVGAVAVLADITERRHFQNERFRMAAIIESTDDAIFSKTLDGTILTWNRGAEKLYRYSAAEVLGRKVSLLAPDDQHDEFGEFLRQVKHGTSIEHYETVRRRKDGTQIDVSLTISPIRDSHGKIIGASTIARDITERKQAEVEIREMNAGLERLVRIRTAHLETVNRELEAFSYTVSHDLRAPLRAIDGFARMFLSQKSSQLDEQGQHYLTVIHTSARKMGRLIDDLLAFSRFGRIEFEKSDIDMTKLAQTVIDELQESNEDTPMSLLIKTLPPAWGNSALVRQVLINLISNAMKFTRSSPNPTIEIGGEVAGSETIYYVRDNGIGFDMQFADKLFSVFQRLHKSEQFEGTGVGLAIVQRVVQRHGGRVWANGKPREGATFFFSLPLKPETK